MSDKKVFSFNKNQEESKSKQTNKDSKGDKKRSRKPLAFIKYIILLLILAAVGLGVYIFFNSLTYNTFETLSSVETTDVNTVTYKPYLDNVVKYSKDGISYISKNGQIKWTVSYAMKMPEVSIDGEYVAVADLNGNIVIILDSNGKVSENTMSNNVCDIDVASQGVFAVILEDTETNYINLYDKNGEPIVEKKTTINKSGYPLDITLSDDGKKLFTSYIYLDGATVKNGLAAYNFGSVGQNENADGLMGGYTFDDTFVPKVEFLNNDTVCAFGDNKFVIYTMKEKPSEKKTIEFKTEIKSIFFSDEYIGAVISNDSSEDSSHYVMNIYNLSGKLILSKSFDVAYTNIKIVGDEIIVLGDTECKIYNMNGKIKFESGFGTKLIDVVPNGKIHEYIVTTENSTDIIKIKYEKED